MENLVSKFNTQHFFELSQDVICVASFDGHLKYVNPAFKQVLQHKKKVLLSQPFLEFVHPEDRSKTEKQFLDLSKGKKTIAFENRYISKDDTIKHIEWKCTPVLNEKLIYCIGRDVTERNKNKLFIKDFIEHSPIAMQLHSLDGSILHVNKAFQKLHSLSDENISLLYEKYNILEDEQAKELGLLPNIQETFKGSPTTFPLYQYNGFYTLKKLGSTKAISHTIWVQTRGIPIKDEHNKVTQVIFMSEDFTENKNAEIEFQRNNQLLEVSQKIAKVGGWELDVTTNHLFWTAETYRIHDTAPEEFNPTVDAGVSYFLPKSREIISKALEEAIKNGIGYDLELETYTTKGRLIHVRTTCEATVIQGKTSKLTGTFQDITHYKNALFKIIESEGKFSNAFDNLPIASTILNLDTGERLAVNKSAEKIFGYSKTALLKENFITTKLATNQDEINRLLNKIKQEGFVVEEPLAIINKDGKVRNTLVNATKLYPNNKDIVITSYRDITENLLMEKKLLESELKFKQVVEQSMVSIFVTDPKGLIVDYNDAYKTLWRLSDKEVSSEYNLREDQELERLKLLPFVEKAFQGEQVILPEIQYNLARLQRGHNHDLPQKQIFWIRSRLYPLINKAGEVANVVVFEDDVSHQKEHELQLIHAKEKAEESQLKYKTLFEESKDAIIISCKDYSIVDINKEALNLLGFAKKEFLQKKVFDLYPYEELKRFKELLQISKKSKDNNLYFESKYITKSNEIIDVEITSKIVDHKNGLVQSIVRNITESKKAKIELIKAKEKAEESAQLKSAFIANMGHEIRTPMNSILGFSNMLIKPNIDKHKQQEYFKIIKKSGDRLMGTLGEIIEVSTIESGIYTVKRKFIELNSIMKSIYRLFQTQAAMKSLELTFHNVSETDEFLFHTDEGKLKSTLTKLLKNALKYTDSGTVEFGYNHKKNNSNEFIEFFVKDSGIGIPQSRLSAIFDKFTQADIKDVQARQGAGLGLTIAKAYVEMLNGKIWVESEVGIGSTFYFTLPMISK